MAHDPTPEIIASWPSPNYINPQSRGLVLVIVGLVLITIVSVVIPLRVYSRVYLGKGFGLDDWLILPAAVFCVGLTSTTCLATLRYGWGKHMWDISTESAEMSLKLLWVSELFFTWSVGLTKLSLCFFYLRLLESSSTHNIRRLVYTCICVVILWAFGFTLAAVVQCNPIKAVWKINYPGEKCVGIKPGMIVHASLDICTDTFIYLLPIPITLGLKLPRWQKHLLLVLFALGGITCTAAVIRVPYTLRSMSDFDTTWYIYDSYIWTTLEAELAIICASMPSLAPILTKATLDFSRSQTREQKLSHYGITKCSTTIPFAGSLANSALPLAHISTTASSTAIVRGSTAGAWYQNWYSGGGGGCAPLCESEENIINSCTDVLTNLTTTREANGITKTTAIVQSVSVETERKTPSPTVAED